MKYVTGLEFNESMSDIIQDFEGNYWMTSYRKGLMLLSRSKFQNGSMKYGLDETIVNCITEYCGKLYIGTDDGLRIINADGTLDRDSDLVTMLNGKSIYCGANSGVTVNGVKSNNWKSYNTGVEAVLKEAGLNCDTLKIKSKSNGKDLKTGWDCNRCTLRMK